MVIIIRLHTNNKVTIIIASEKRNIILYDTEELVSLVPSRIII